MDLTILVENLCGRRDVLGEYGFSVHLRSSNGESFLMDTGQGKTLLSNAGKLNIDLSKISNLVLSHGHFDHVWGVPELLALTGNIPVWAHCEFDKARYRRLQDRSYYIGSYIHKEDINFKPISNVTQVAPDIWAVEVPLDKRDYEFVPGVGHLVVAENGDWKPDLFEDDISLVVKGEYGYSVILGCAHAGIVNIMAEVSRLFNTKEFYCVIGGMHIGEQSGEFCTRVVDKLVNDYKVKVWRPSHCTGFKAAAMLAAKTADTTWGSCGTVLKL